MSKEGIVLTETQLKAIEKREAEKKLTAKLRLSILDISDHKILFMLALSKELLESITRSSLIHFEIHFRKTLQHENADYCCHCGKVDQTIISFIWPLKTLTTLKQRSGTLR